MEEFDPDPLDVCEIFPTIQGEGKDTGAHALFIRLFGCNRNCEWCDTPYAKGKGEEHGLVPQAAILRALSEYHQESGNGYIVWTGGEPLLQERRIYSVIRKTNGFYHHLETNGDIVPDKPYLFNSIAVSPKEDPISERWNTIKNATIKLVVNNIQEAINFFENNQIPRHRFYVMMRSIPPDPLDEGLRAGIQSDKENQLARECVRCGFNFSPRLQVLYGWGRAQ